MDTKRPPFTTTTNFQHHQQQQQQQQQQQSNAIATTKSIQVFEVLNKIQNVINSESLVPQFIYFAKSMDDMRKKWLQAELKVKEMEKKLYQSNMEKSTFQRQIDELKIDIEMHHEKRQLAENERDKLLKQIELFKEILNGDKKYESIKDDERINLLTTYSAHFHSNSPYKLNRHNSNNNNSNNINNIQQSQQQPAFSQHIHSNSNLPPSRPSVSRKSERRSNNKIEETGLLISDYTEDDIDISDFDDEEIPKSNANKRSRARSNDQKRDSLSNGITAITTLKIGDAGTPITVTSQIKQNQPDSTANLKDMDTAFTTSSNQRKGRKKRPSREFLQRNADESISTEDSEVFWNGSEAVVAEVAASINPITGKPNSNNNNNIHIMTPIVEAPTPSHQTTRHYTRQLPNVTPLKASQIKSISANSIPLARKYKKAHLFKGQVILNSELCAHCDKRTKFGKMIMKCRECDIVVHTECKDLLQRPCYPACHFPASGNISDYATDESPRIPPILQMIINEIELRGIAAQEVGLYRVNGSDSQIKQLKERLIKRHQLPDLRKIHDVHVLCSFVKDFLNSLTEHLVTYDSWYRFAKACDIQNETDRQLSLQQAIEDLPLANRDTLAFIVLHLQRISETPECKMPTNNLARVFGPSLVGNSLPNMAPAEIINEINTQQRIVENLIKLPSSFYSTFVDGVDHQQRLFKNPPKTPEIMRKSKTAVVLSSILGPASNLPSQQQHQHQQSNKVNKF